MLTLAPHMQIVVVVQPTDFRAGIDGLCQRCRELLGLDPFSGTVFVFRNRRGTSLKILVYDGQGFWLSNKRFSAGRIMHWPTSTGVWTEVHAHQLTVLLMNGDPSRTDVPPAWRPLRREAMSQAATAVQ